MAGSPGKAVSYPNPRAFLDKRWDISNPEDNETSALQQIGLASPFSKPGRLSYAEPLVHVFNNWVLDRVLGTRG